MKIRLQFCLTLTGIENIEFITWKRWSSSQGILAQNIRVLWFFHGNWNQVLYTLMMLKRLWSGSICDVELKDLWSNITNLHSVHLIAPSDLSQYFLLWVLFFLLSKYLLNTVSDRINLVSFHVSVLACGFWRWHTLLNLKTFKVLESFFLPLMLREYAFWQKPF